MNAARRRRVGGFESVCGDGESLQPLSQRSPSPNRCAQDLPKDLVAETGQLPAGFPAIASQLPLEFPVETAELPLDLVAEAAGVSSLPAIGHSFTPFLCRRPFVLRVAAASAFLFAALRTRSVNADRTREPGASSGASSSSKIGANHRKRQNGTEEPSTRRVCKIGENSTTGSLLLV